MYSVVSLRVQSCVAVVTDRDRDDAAPAGVSVGQLGWPFGSFTAAGAAISSVSGWVNENVGFKRTLLAAPFVVAALGVGGVAVVAVVPGFVVMRATRRLVSPLAGRYLNDGLSAVDRATGLSVVATVYAVVVPFRVLAGGLADGLPAVEVVLLGAVVLAATGVYLGARLVSFGPGTVTASSG